MPRYGFVGVIVLLVSLSAQAAVQDTRPATPAQSDRLTRLAARGRVTRLNTMPAGSVKIDGDLSEWGLMANGGAVIDERLNCALGQVDPQIRGAAGFKVARDEQNLYVAVRVVDASVITRSPAFEGDAVELFVDIRPLRGDGPKLGDPKYSPGVWQIAIVPPAKEGESAAWQLGMSGGPLGPIEVAGKRLADGYSIEVKLPLTSMNVARPERLSEPVGIDVGIDDIDDIAGKGVTGRVQYVFSRSASSWSDASVFGVADPAFTAPKDGCLRRFSAGLGSGENRRYVIGGLITSALDTSAKAPSPIDIVCVYRGKTEASGVRDTLVLGAQQREITPCPQLGATVVRVARDIASLKRGKYEVVTRFAGIDQAPLVRKFDSSPWPLKPLAGVPWTPPPGMVLPNTTDAEGRTLLSSGWKLSPAGKATALPGDMPVKMLWSADRRRLLVQTAGFHDPAVNVVDVASNKVVQTVKLPRSWPGMTFDAAGKVLYVSTGIGADGARFRPIARFAWDGATLTAMEPLAIPALVARKTWVSGLLAFQLAGRGLVCVLDEQRDSVLVLSSDSMSVEHGIHVGYHPYAAALSPDAATLAVSNWGGESVSLISTGTWQAAEVRVGSHPNELTWAGDGRLFVACSGSNSVSVLRGGKAIETIKTSLQPDAPVGSTPIALALSADQKTLYVANADNNDIAVIDVAAPGSSAVKGFIPTGWYPSALTVGTDGTTLFVGVGKGLGYAASAHNEYVGNLLTGALSVVNVPSEKALKAYTRQVTANTPRAAAASELSAQDKVVLNDVLPKIKHVLFVIRENRTYDQVLGDLNIGNGDASLTMFGSDVTPNAHAIAKQFVLLDNLYCSGEVSEDGHQWCNAAYATDFTEKAWENSYARDREPDADERLTASPAGYLWDNCRAHGKTYLSYGEFASFRSTPTSAPVFDGVKGLEGHASTAWSDTALKRDIDRAGVFVNDLTKAEQSGDWPQYMVMSLGEDHTVGTTPGMHTPEACVASNDQALGMIVEAVCRSKFWNQTAIFVTEDDAQDGADHVDAHRTVGFVISPYTKRAAVDHTLYTTVSMVRTMEIILGLPPMTQYDAAARPMLGVLGAQAMSGAYACIPAEIDLLAKNPTGGEDAEASLRLDFSGFDRADPQILNGILWRHFKPGVPMPPPVRSALALR